MCEAFVGNKDCISDYKIILVKTLRKGCGFHGKSSLDNVVCILETAAGFCDKELFSY